LRIVGNAIYVLAAAVVVLAAGVMMIRDSTPAPAVEASQQQAIPTWRYSIVTSYPHDPAAFTQGLQYLNGFMYEGTGLNGRSSIRKVELKTGKVVQERALASQHFGEGITIWKNTLFQLTWQSGVAFVYDAATFAPKPTTFTYRGEGWGLTHDEARLIMSDGTSELRFLDPATFKELRRVKVMADGQPIVSLNELEYVKGEIFANIWQTDTIARINPQSGAVLGWIDMRGLLSARERTSTDVLNGIAYDAATDRLFVTGKLWPRLFEIKLVK
jgi:glutamine cyclotransferase